jgi:signal transduction histidine kinase
MGTPGGVLEHETFSELRSQFRTEQQASWGAAIGVVVLAVGFGVPWGFALAAAIVAMALVRARGFTMLDRSDIGGAMGWSAAGNWGVAIVVVALIPDALPIMVLNLIGPLVTSAHYLDKGQLRRLTAAAVVVAIALGALGFRSEGTGIEDGIPEWLFQVIMIMYLVAHVVMMIMSVGTANRVRLETLTAIADTNRALREADAELRASRRRAIAAGDGERVRIERNIHDGAQQRLVALAVQLQLASQLARSGTPVTPDTLDAMHAESREAIDELRELARGIYPSVLTERGLDDALRSVASRSPNPVDVVYDCATELTPEDSAAIYFICLEALQNVAKHAGPQATARVAVEDRDAGLTVSVIDDGPGCDPTSIASSRGVLNMTDRAGALGGELSIDSAPGDGTRITMVLPRRPAGNMTT